MRRRTTNFLRAFAVCAAGVVFAGGLQALAAGATPASNPYGGPGPNPADPSLQPEINAGNSQAAATAPCTASVDARLAPIVGCASVEAAVAADERFRKALGLQSDETFVRSLYNDPSSSTGNRALGALLTPAETQTVKTRLRLNATGDRIDMAYASTSGYAGAWIDNVSGVLHVGFTAAATASSRGGVAAMADDPSSIRQDDRKYSPTSKASWPRSRR